MVAAVVELRANVILLLDDTPRFHCKDMLIDMLRVLYFSCIFFTFHMIVKSVTYCPTRPAYVSALLYED